MPSTNKTAKLNLSQYISTDTPTMQDYNSDMQKIESIDSAYLMADVPACQVYNTAAQAIGNQVYNNYPFYNTVAFDTSGMFNPATPNILTCKKAGIYQINSAAVFATNATGERVLGILKNGTDWVSFGTPASAAGLTRICLDYKIFLALNDTIKLYAYQNSGAALNINGGRQTFLEALWLRP